MSNQTLPVDVHRLIIEEVAAPSHPLALGIPYPTTSQAQVKMAPPGQARPPSFFVLQKPALTCSLVLDFDFLFKRYHTPSSAFISHQVENILHNMPSLRRSSDLVMTSPWGGQPSLEEYANPWGSKPL